MGGGSGSTPSQVQEINMVGFIEAVDTINDPSGVYIELSEDDENYIFTTRAASVPIEAGTFYKYADNEVDFVIDKTCISMRESQGFTNQYLKFPKMFYDLGEVYDSVNRVNATFKSPIVKYCSINGYQAGYGSGQANVLYMSNNTLVANNSTALTSTTFCYAYYPPSSSPKVFTGENSYFIYYKSNSIFFYDLVSVN